MVTKHKKKSVVLICNFLQVAASTPGRVLDWHRRANAPMIRMTAIGQLLPRLAQDSVLRFGFLRNRQVWIGVLPERQGIFIRFSRCHFIVHDYRARANCRMERAPVTKPAPTPRNDRELFETRLPNLTFLESKLRKTSKIRRIHIVKTVGDSRSYALPAAEIL